MMNSVFREMLYEGSVANYMDDFIIPGKMEKVLDVL